MTAKFKNPYREMPATASAAEFLGLTEEIVFWAIVDFAVKLANDQIPTEEPLRMALYRSEYFWMWITLIWESTDKMIMEDGILIKKDKKEGNKTITTFYVLEKESNTYSHFDSSKAEEFYVNALHKPRWEHEIPAYAYREARAFAKAMPLATIKQEFITATKHVGRKWS